MCAGFCCCCKPLPLGEVSPKVTERASPARKSRCAAIGRLFVRAILSLCKNCLAASLPSQALRASSPRGGASGVSARPMLDEQSFFILKTAVPCYRGQQLRNNVPCQAAANLCSRALYFTPYWASSGQRKVARPAKASPTRRGGTPQA